MSNLWLTVEVAPGAEIDSACQEAVALAEKTGLLIWFSIGGVMCSARTGDDPRRIEESLETELKRMRGSPATTQSSTHSEVADKLGPLPQPVDELCMDDGFNVIGTQPVFTADQMRAYAADAVAAERERGERKLAQAEYLIGAFERGADAAEYGRDIAEFRA